METRVYQRAVFPVLAALLLLSIVSRLLDTIGTGDAKGHGHAKEFVKQSLHWSALCRQDTNPIFALQHINYAVAYLNAAKTLVSDASLEQTCGRDVHTLQSELRKMQQRAIGSLSKTCPKSLPKGTTVTTWLS